MILICLILCSGEVQEGGLPGLEGVYTSGERLFMSLPLSTNECCLIVLSIFERVNAPMGDSEISGAVKCEKL